MAPSISLQDEHERAERNEDDLTGALKWSASGPRKKVARNGVPFLVEARRAGLQYAAKLCIIGALLI
jgi:hypothetical protein